MAASPSPVDRPLDGILVVDFSTLLPGPLATLMLAEAGAEVVKIERPGGEDMRAYPPFVDNVSVPFAMLNRGKASVEIDLKDEAARGRLWPLLARADVVVEQFRPGVMDRLGLGYEAIRVVNPGVIFCSITGYGQSGPRADEAGHDLNYQGAAGVLALGAGHAVPSTLTADIAGGTFPAVTNILMALIRRGRTGAGAKLDIAMADAMFTFALFAHGEAGATGAAPKPGAWLLHGGSPRYQLYPLADGRLLAVGALEEKFWRAFTALVGLPWDLIDDRRDPAATKAAIAAWAAGQSSDALRPRLAAADCCATIVATLDEALADPHFVGRGLFDHHVDVGTRAISACVMPIERTFRAPTRTVAAPRLGAANALYLATCEPRPDL